MSRYLNNHNEIPPGGYRFYQPETKFMVTAPSWKDLLAMVQKHRSANQIPIGGSFEREIEDYVCSQIPGDWCSDLNPNRTAEVPRNDWPLWAKLLAMKATPQDSGIGDVVARSIGPFGGDAYKRWFQETYNRPCGCTERQESLNAQYPL